MSHSEKDNASEIDTGNASGSSDYGATGVDRTKDSFEKLLEVLPPSEGDDMEMSPNKIMEKSVDYIKSKVRQNAAEAAEIREIERTNKKMEKLIKSFNKAKAQGDISALERISDEISKLVGSSE